jgi:hypothetical protein
MVFTTVVKATRSSIPAIGEDIITFRGDKYSSNFSSTTVASRGY